MIIPFSPASTASNNTNTVVKSFDVLMVMKCTYFVHQKHQHEHYCYFMFNKERQNSKKRNKRERYYNKYHRKTKII